MNALIEFIPNSPKFELTKILECVMFSNKFNLTILIADEFVRMDLNPKFDNKKIKTISNGFIKELKKFGLNENTKIVFLSDLIKTDNFMTDVLTFSMNITVKECTDTHLPLILFEHQQPDNEFKGSHLMMVPIRITSIKHLKPDVVLTSKLNIESINKLLNGIEIQEVNEPLNLKGPKSKINNQAGLIFTNDNIQDITRKIMKGFCDDSIVNNPIFELSNRFIRPFIGKEQISQEAFIKCDKLEFKKELIEDIKTIMNGK